MNAWPCFSSYLVDGWVLRYAEGYTRRANSATSIVAPSGGLGASIDACERLFGVLGIPPMFRLRGAGDGPDTEADALLAARGYAIAARSLVETLEPLDPFGGAAEGLALGASPLPSEEWAAVACALRGHSQEAGIYQRLLARIRLPSVYLLATGGDGPVGAAMAVVDGEAAWVFGVIVAASARRKGVARAMMSRLGAECAARGAARLCLQVEETNAAARSLYEGMGYVPLYRYWYRAGK